MRSKQSHSSEAIAAADRSRDLPCTSSEITVGQFAYQVIAQQYQRMGNQEQGVLADQDPEYLHQMRVGSRRLRTALQVFSQVVKLSQKAGAKRIRNIARTLGSLRDLDVQMADIQSDYIRQVSHKKEKRVLKQTLKTLEEERVDTYEKVSSLLTSKDYQDLKLAYDQWLEFPRFKPNADLPLQVVLPDLLTPLISRLLLHRGWLVSVHETSKSSREMLHDLRKMIKHVRYQTEFFCDCYGSSFQEWVDELKLLQDNLGKVQDTYVFANLLAQYGENFDSLSELDEVIHQNRSQAMVDWEAIRHRYLAKDFRYHLYEMILHPTSKS
jgi:CHAD domain-containing protein